MEGHDSGRLKDTKIAAQYIQSGLSDIEKVLMSIDGLMPDEANKEEALETAHKVFQEIKGIEEAINLLKVQMKSKCEASRLENERADAAIKSMQESISQIEDTLGNFGYDSSKMPAHPSPMPSMYIESPNESFQLDEAPLDEMEDEIECDLPSSPSKQEEHVLSESLAGVEITPLVLSSKSISKTHCSASASSSPVLPCSSGVKIKKEHISPCKYTYRCGPYLYVSPNCAYNQTSETKLKSSVKATKILEKPRRPVFSKTTYDLLGEKPPPEYYVGGQNA